MQLGMVGLGKMGGNMTQRLIARRASGRRVRSRTAKSVQQAVAGGRGIDGAADLVGDGCRS